MPPPCDVLAVGAPLESVHIRAVLVVAGHLCWGCPVRAECGDHYRSAAIGEGEVLSIGGPGTSPQLRVKGAESVLAGTGSNVTDADVPASSYGNEELGVWGGRQGHD
jgi:hypothetical protein